VDRYEPLPGIAALPGWLWRRTGWGTRLTIAALLVVVAAAAALLIPAQRADTERRAGEADRARMAAAERRAKEIQADQRPRRGLTDPSPAGAGRAAQLAARASALDDLRSAIRDDALRRVRAGSLSGPIGAVECERHPRADDVLPPERDLSVRIGRYACLAVTRRFEGGALGHPYRAQIDFETGRFAYCKITGSPELARDPRLATPRACGG
jgi:hypothetical protein